MIATQPADGGLEPDTEWATAIADGLNGVRQTSHVPHPEAADDRASHGPPVRPFVHRFDQRLLGALLCALGMLPSLLWLLAGPDLLTDDFGHTLVFREEGLLGGALDRSFESTGRPFVGVYYLLTYGLIGDTPELHAIVMAALNGVLVVTVWRVGRRIMPANAAYLAALLLAVVPNRASTRLWFATGNYVLATILVIIGLALVIVWSRPVYAAILLTIGILLFEGTAGLVAAGISLWALDDPKGRIRTAALVAAPPAITAVGMYLASPKRSSSGPTWRDSVETIGAGLLGEGLWGPTFGAIGSVVLLTTAVVAGVLLLPSFRRPDRHLRTVRIGAVAALIGSAPFIVGGSPFATQGIFDRTNLIPLVGVSVLIAGAIDALSRRTPRAAWGIALVAVTLFAGQNIADVDDYRDAVVTGQGIIHSVEVVAPIDGEPVVVVPHPPDKRGVAAFVYPADLDHAISLRVPEQEATTLLPRLPADCRAIVAEGRASIYDWQQGRVLPSTPPNCAS